MSDPVHIAAIDAGSNALRLAVARAYSALDIEPLVNERYSLRLGESVFLRHRFSEELFKRGVKAFRHFHEIMEEFGVTRYRAVATSASREARNRDAFVRQIKQKTGIALQVDQLRGGIAAWAGRGARGARTGIAAAVHRRFGRRKPGTQHPSRSQRGARRAVARGHGAVDEHAQYSRRDPAGASRAGAEIRARVAGIADTIAAKSWRSKLRWRSEGMRKLWRTSRPARDCMACRRWRFRCCARGSPIFWSAMFASG